MFKIESHLLETDSRHSDMADAYAYMVASQYAKLADDYFFLYVKKKPRYVPNWLYKWFIGKFIVLVKFK